MPDIAAFGKAPTGCGPADRTYILSDSLHLRVESAESVAAGNLVLAGTVFIPAG